MKTDRNFSSPSYFFSSVKGTRKEGKKSWEGIVPQQACQHPPSFDLFSDSVYARRGYKSSTAFLDSANSPPFLVRKASLEQRKELKERSGRRKREDIEPRVAFLSTLSLFCPDVSRPCPGWIVKVRDLRKISMILPHLSIFLKERGCFGFNRIGDPPLDFLQSTPPTVTLSQKKSDPHRGGEQNKLCHLFPFHPFNFFVFSTPVCLVRGGRQNFGLLRREAC